MHPTQPQPYRNQPRRQVARDPRTKIPGPNSIADKKQRLAENSKRYRESLKERNQIANDENQRLTRDMHQLMRLNMDWQIHVAHLKGEMAILEAKITVLEI